MRTIILSGPKRSGTTLINRLFDSQPGIVNLNDEAFFWEHVHKYDEASRLSIFTDLFRSMSAEALRDGLIERDLLPWIEGVYRQWGADEFERNLNCDGELFLNRLEELKDASNIQDVWFCLVRAYADSVGCIYDACHSVFIKAADYGRSILGGRKNLEDCRFLTIIRNPYYAIDSLKKARAMRQEKMLNPFNLGEVILDYLFWWENLKEILAADTFLIEYERLVLESEKVMREISAFLNIEFTENLLKPTFMGDEWHGLSSFNKTKGIDLNALKRSLKMLDRDEIDYIERHLGEIIDYFGYSCNNQSKLF